MQNEDFEKQRILIEGDNVNITESNVLKEFIQIIINIILAIVLIYYTVFFISGIVIKFMPVEKQVMFENIITKVIMYSDTHNPENEDLLKINNMKNKIMEYDKKFPKTSNLDVKIIKSKELNAYCAPNGNIYITEALYSKIKNQEEMLFFIIAHEMAHYKNRDHIMNIRKNIASSAVLITTIIIGNNQTELFKPIEATLNLSDLKYSRKVETRADKYAGIMLLKQYGNTNGGIKVLEVLSQDQYPEVFSIFSTHPSSYKRIKYLKRLTH